MKSAPTVAFHYRPSRILLMALLAVAALAIAAIALCGFALWFKLTLICIAGMYAARAVRDFLQPRFDRCVWHSAGPWRLRDMHGAECNAELVHAVVLGTLIVLTLRRDSKRRIFIPLLVDNCDAETQRHLRIRVAQSRRGDIAMQ